jgi:hypothetical protein
MQYFTDFVNSILNAKTTPRPDNAHHSCGYVSEDGFADVIERARKAQFRGFWVPITLDSR